MRKLFGICLFLVLLTVGTTYNIDNNIQLNDDDNQYPDPVPPQSSKVI